ncbi:hypothetical protein I5Q31_05600 [Serratia marcescens]|nr:hypothetical protein [Serratia marcescens]MBH2766643.1 hypothetical protein [Serratia marcescens]MBH2766703.1 hypothetical protein [Serratia marcescens]
MASDTVVFQSMGGVEHQLIPRAWLQAGTLVDNEVIAEGRVDSPTARQLAVAWNESCGSLQDVASRKRVACIIANEQGRYPVRFALSNPDATEILSAGLRQDTWYGQGLNGELRYGVQVLDLGSRAEGIYRVAVNAAAYEP